jgi:hypothetical protein
VKRFFEYLTKKVTFFRPFSVSAAQIHDEEGIVEAANDLLAPGKMPILKLLLSSRERRLPALNGNRTL